MRAFRDLQTTIACAGAEVMFKWGQPKGLVQHGAIASNRRVAPVTIALDLVDTLSAEGRSLPDRTHPSQQREAAVEATEGWPETLLAAAADAPAQRRQQLLDDVIVHHLDLAESIARQFAGRGVELDDLIQVARLALCKAARRYCPARGGSFVAYAVPTVSGEIKRHFRDTGWMVRPPRRLQELRAQVATASEELTRSRHEDPSEERIALALGVESREVREARLCEGGYRSVSLDEPDRTGYLGAPFDAGYARVDDALALRSALEALTAHELLILRLRFVEERTQSQIGATLGVSQMQVSRLLTGILGRLRSRMNPACAA